MWGGGGGVCDTPDHWVGVFVQLFSSRLKGTAGRPFLAPEHSAAAKRAAAAPPPPHPPVCQGISSKAATFNRESLPRIKKPQWQPSRDGH